MGGGVITHMGDAGEGGEETDDLTLAGGAGLAEDRSHLSAGSIASDLAGLDGAVERAGFEERLDKGGLGRGESVETGGEGDASAGLSMGVEEDEEKTAGGSGLEEQADELAAMGTGETEESGLGGEFAKEGMDFKSKIGGSCDAVVEFDAVTVVDEFMGEGGHFVNAGVFVEEEGGESEGIEYVGKGGEAGDGDVGLEDAAKVGKEEAQELGGGGGMGPGAVAAVGAKIEELTIGEGDVCGDGVVDEVCFAPGVEILGFFVGFWGEDVGAGDDVALRKGCGGLGLWHPGIDGGIVGYVAPPFGGIVADVVCVREAGLAVELDESDAIGGGEGTELAEEFGPVGWGSVEGKKQVRELTGTNDRHGSNRSLVPAAIARAFGCEYIGRRP